MLHLIYLHSQAFVTFLNFRTARGLLNTSTFSLYNSYKWSVNLFFSISLTVKREILQNLVGDIIKLIVKEVE